MADLRIPFQFVNWSISPFSVIKTFYHYCFLWHHFSKLLQTFIACFKRDFRHFLKFFIVKKYFVCVMLLIPVSFKVIVALTRDVIVKNWKIEISATTGLYLWAKTARKLVICAKHQVVMVSEKIIFKSIWSIYLCLMFLY